MTSSAGTVPGGSGVSAPPAGEDLLAEALEANRLLAELATGTIEDNAELRAQVSVLLQRDAERESEQEELRAQLAVLQKIVFGRSSEKARPEPGGAEDQPAAGRDGEKKDVKRGPGARAGRRDYSHLPKYTVTWDFEGGGYCCPECGEPFTPLGGHLSGEQLDWQVIVRVVAHCRRRYRRACGCRVPATVMAPGPPKAIGKGLVSNGFIAMLLTERFTAGRSMNSLITGLARQGADISPATLAGTCERAAGLLAPLASAISGRNRDSWLLHADETTWRVFCPPDGGGPAKWWLWVFIGPDTVCFVMDPSRSGAVLARHAGLDEKTGQLLPGDDGAPRRLVISSDFYAVYQSAGKKADGLVNLYCWSHLRRHVIRAGDANPEQLRRWSDAWVARIGDLYAAHRELMAAWQGDAGASAKDKDAAGSRLEDARKAWDTAITVIDETRKQQAKGPGLAEPAKKALATLDREWDGLIAHRDYPMADLDNNLAERTIRGPVVTRKNAGGSRNGDTARNAAAIWTVTATAQMAGLNILTYLDAYLDACGHAGGKPLAGEDLDRFLPWNASPEDLRTWAQPPPPPETQNQ